MTSTPARIIKVVIVDDSSLVRTGLRTLLGAEPSVQIVGEAGSVAAAIETITEARPDVVLMDIRLPDGTGFDACREALLARPGTRVLFLTSVVDDQLVERAIRSGGHGYLLKEIEDQDLIQAIHDVAAGKSILDPAVTARVLQLVKSGSPAEGLQSLSVQERRVLGLIAEGKTNKEVGLELDLTEKTVKNYLANIFSKLNVTRRAQAVAMFVAHQRQP